MNTENNIDRARSFIASRNLQNAATHAADNPLSPEAQNAALVAGASKVIDHLNATKESLAGSGNYSLKGVAAELAPHVTAAREQVEDLKAKLDKRGENILQQAREATAAPVLEFTDTEQRTLAAFNSLPADRQKQIRTEAISSNKHPELVRAWLAGPAFASNLDPKTRARLEQRFDTADPVKRDAILSRAKLHQQAALSIGSVLAEIDAF